MAMPAETLNTNITTLGAARIPSPVHKRVHGTNGFGFVSEDGPGPDRRHRESGL